jgi:hypothetical protein
MMMRRASITSATRSVLFAWPSMLRTAGAASTAPILFCTGETTSLANRAEYPANYPEGWHP